MKTRILLTGAVAVLLALVLVACVGGSLFPGTTSSVVFPTTPKFLIAVDGGILGAKVRGNSATSFANVNVFPVDATTGVLGAAITGSPFDLGLTDGMTLAVHPNGHFVYAADGLDGSIHAWNVSETTGIPTEIATPVINESGSFYEPCCGGGDAPTHVITITPNGDFLYSGNNDATVGAYKINADGSLAHIADLDIGACDTGAITANDTYVWVNDTCGNSGPWNIFTLKIGTNGGLTNASSVALTGVFGWLWSIQVNPAANFLYAGDEGGDAQVYSFSIAADGALTQLGPQVVENSSSDCRDIAHSPDGKFFYTTDDDESVHAFSVDTTTGAITELSASPYNPGGEGQIVVDLTGKFVYMGDQEDTGQVIGYTRDLTTGALTLTGGTTTANGVARAIAIVR
jgi:6-phosphogluconolactonase (cycloisomerase 2 family)